MLAAEAADDPVRMAAAKWNLGHILLAQGEADGAEDGAMTAIENLQRDTADDDLDAVGMAGALWLVSVVAAVRSNDPWTARDRLRDKASPAAQMTGDTNVMWWTVFGRSNVGLHAVSVEMEMGVALLQGLAELGRCGLVGHGGGLSPAVSGRSEGMPDGFADRGIAAA